MFNYPGREELWDGECGSRVFDFTNNSSWGWGIPMGWAPTISNINEKTSEGSEIYELSGMLFSDITMTPGDFIIVNPCKNHCYIYKILKVKNLGNPPDCWQVTARTDGLAAQGFLDDHGCKQSNVKTFNWKGISEHWSNDKILNEI